jgi:hypothetical protein
LLARDLTQMREIIRDYDPDFDAYSLDEVRIGLHTLVALLLPLTCTLCFVVARRS